MVLSWIAAGCSSQVREAFTPTAFSSGYGYEVRYLEGDQLLPPTWVLENYVRRNGERVHRDQLGATTTYEFDNDDNGLVDDHVELSTHALRFENKVSAGVIWLRNVPMSRRMASKDLRVVMREYVDGIASSSYEVVRFADCKRPVVVKRRDVAAILHQTPVTVAGVPGFLAVIDLADAEQARVATNVRTRRIALVIWRTPVAELSKGRRYPTVAIAGYANLPDDFDGGLADFHGLLGRIAIRGMAGFAPPTSPPPAETTTTTFFRRHSRR